MPEIKIKLSDIKKGINFLDFIAKNKIFSSKSEARRAIENKGLKIDDIVVIDEKKILQLKDFKNKIFKTVIWKEKTLFSKNYLVCLFLSIIFCINLGVNVFIGLILF